MNINMNINIYGAGITGLTIAHELVEKGFNVKIYEKDNVIGGMARSTRTTDNVPSEHSWRAYGPFYENLYNIIKRIPIDSICPTNNNKTIEKYTDEKYTENLPVYSIEEISSHNSVNDAWVHLDGIVYDITNFINIHPGGSVIEKSLGKNLKEVWGNNGVSWHNSNNLVNEYLFKNKIGVTKEFNEKFRNDRENSHKKNSTVFDNLNLNELSFDEGLLNNKRNNNDNINFLDLPFLYYTFLKVALSNNRLDEYFEERLEPILKDNVSKKTYDYLVNFISGPGYGFDKNTMSLGHYGYFIELNFYKNFQQWSVMNKPTSEAWFDYWKIYLESKGVEFYFNHNVNKINFKDNKISNIQLENNNNTISIDSGEHIICLNPFIYQKILENSNVNNILTKTIEDYKGLNIVNNQISFRIGFNKKINLKKNSGYILIDSPYNITFYAYEHNWCDNIDLGLNGQIKSLWSGTIIISYNSGSLTGKSATSLNKDELLEEIKHQIIESEDLVDLVKKYNDNYILTKNDMTYGEIFEDWEYKKDRLVSKNPKFVNNFINEKYKPDNITKFENLYIGGSHTKTSVRVWSMESAVESGKIVSNILLKKYNKQKCSQYTHKSANYLLLFKCLDDFLYKLNLPHLINCIILVILIIIILYILKIIKNY